MNTAQTEREVYVSKCKWAIYQWARTKIENLKGRGLYYFTGVDVEAC